MRLKVQCQNLLIIARKLVSHLGEYATPTLQIYKASPHHFPNIILRLCLSHLINFPSFLGEFTDLCREIMLEAKKLTLAERCSIFLLDQESQELVAKVFDGVPAAEVRKFF